MAVKLHGVVRAQREDGASVTPLHAPARLPAPAPAPEPRKPETFRAPWTVGRAIYFVLLATGLTAGGLWLANWARFVSATGVVERDVDRLSPRERGRITKIAVKNGDPVKAGQPLVWLDFEGPNGFISDATARANAQDATLQAMHERRQELDRLLAEARTSLAGYDSTARGLDPQRRTLAHSQLSALRLRREGAATDAEVSQYSVQLQQIEQQLATARDQAHAQERVLTQLHSEALQLDKALAQKAPAPKPADVGIIAASRDGVVAWLPAHVGEVVGPESAVIMLTDDTHVRVRAYVAPKDATSLVPGKPAEVRLPSGELLKAKVNRVSLLASVAPEPSAPSLGKPQQPTLTSTPTPPVDPNAAFLLADVTVLEVPASVASHLASGAPCEVRVKREWGWLRDLWPFGK